jgi:uncharacterized membrane protein SpoIIM required for sporulation
MTPLQFESEYSPRWRELESALDRLDGKKPRKNPFDAAAAGHRETVPAAAPDAARVAALYRSACEQLALARARDYPAHLVERLEQLTHRAHQQVYHRSDAATGRIARLFLVAIPQAVRAHRGYLLVATLAFALPLVGTAVGAALDPGFALMLHDAESLRSYEKMYGSDAQAYGRQRGADSDFQMLGHYIMNNIGIAFRTFAGGLFAGIGALLVLVFNGLYAGTIAGHLTSRGLGDNFYSFVVTHGAFELTAIVLSGAAGLAIGHALLAPGRRTRATALRESALAAVPVLYGVFALLVVAAVVEAFWSSARWVPHEVKYGVGGACWLLVLGWLGWQGRARKAST